jgi:hypothetical protein
MLKRSLTTIGTFEAIERLPARKGCRYCIRSCVRRLAGLLHQASPLLRATPAKPTGLRRVLWRRPLMERNMLLLDNLPTGATGSRRRRPPGAPLVLALAAAVAMPDVALAYVGPGAGLTAIGTVVALVAAVLLALVGFVWYPLKRMLRGKPRTLPEAEPGTDDPVRRER